MEQSRRGFSPPSCKSAWVKIDKQSSPCSNLSISKHCFLSYSPSMKSHCLCRRGVSSVSTPTTSFSLHSWCMLQTCPPPALKPKEPPPPQKRESAHKREENLGNAAQVMGDPQAPIGAGTMHGYSGKWREIKYHVMGRMQEC